MGGVLVGEGVYGLAYIADTTYPPYWWGQIAVGVALLCAIAVGRLRSPPLVALSVAVGLVVAAAFVGVYSGGLPLLYSS